MAYYMGQILSTKITEEFPMQLPSPDPDTLFEDMLQDLPSETVEMARKFKAFARARKIKTPQQLLRAVLLYCGLDRACARLLAP
jgi:hypothetical protein